VVGPPDALARMAALVDDINRPQEVAVEEGCIRVLDPGAFPAVGLLDPSPSVEWNSGG